MNDELAQVFLRARPRLERVAYAILGSRAEAEDVVSDCWLRLADAAAREHIDDVDAWATVAVARRALDVLRSARVRRERYVGPWLPEPVLAAMPGATDPGSAGVVDPADRVTLDDSVSFALLVVLETLTPAERTAFVLHDLFGLPFPEVAAAVGRTPDAVRKLAARARQHITERAPRLQVDAAQHQAAYQAFLAAASGGDLAALLAVLDPDVVLTSDGGGQVRSALRPVHGADRVGRFVLGIVRKIHPEQRAVAVVVNGAAGLAVLDGERVDTLMSLTVTDGLITRVDLLRAPAKLSGLRVPT